jgi:hypothetical protein
VLGRLAAPVGKPNHRDHQADEFKLDKNSNRSRPHGYKTSGTAGRVACVVAQQAINSGDNAAQ